MSEEHNSIDQNGVTQQEGMDTQESNTQAGGETENDDERKLFVGGLGWDTSQKELQEYMEKFGPVASCALKTDQETGKSRGFGFVVFEDSSTIDKVLEQKEHKIKDRKIDPKRANPRGDKENKKKIFVGKVAPTTTEEVLKTYFEQFGQVEKVELPYDKMKDMRRNFIFVEFDAEETVAKILAQEKHKIGDDEVDIKKVTPPNNPRGRGGRGFGFRGGDRGRGGRGGGWNYGGGGGGWGNQGGYGQQGYNQGYGGYNQGGYGGGAGGYGGGYQGYNYGAYDQSGYGYGGYSGWGGYDQSGYGYGGYGNGGYQAGYDYSGWGGYDQSGQQAAGYGKAPKGGRGGGYRPY